MKEITNIYGLFMAVLYLVAVNASMPQANAQPIGVPQLAPYNNDAHTVLLEHFDGTTSGSLTTPTWDGIPNAGSVSYTGGIFGQGIHLNIGSWVSWSMGGLAEGTVEFWGRMDTLDFGGLAEAGFIRASYWPFRADTFLTLITADGFPMSGYHCGFVGRPGGDWIRWAVSTPITAGDWHHYATTWGSQGFNFYVDGALALSSADTYAQNSSTAVWAIGGPDYSPWASGPGFTGVIDELRISNIQRDFTVVPEPSSVALFSVIGGTLCLLRGRRILA